MRHFLRVLIASALGATSALSWADIVYTFNAAGVTENVAQQGTAIFDFSNDASTLTITLVDNVDPTEAVASEISGLQFAFTQAPAAITLVAASASLAIDCSLASSAPCPLATDVPALYGWGATITGGVMTLGAGYSGGAFGFQPFDIVNQNYVAAGLSDGANNPLLVGPVTFTFALTGLPFVPEVSSTTFMFGDPILVLADPIPEPGSLALVGIALISIAFVGWFDHRRRS